MPTLAQDRREMIDDATRTEFARVVAYAREQGLDLAETLDRAGLLLTKDRRRFIVLAQLVHMVEELEAVEPSQMLAMGLTLPRRGRSFEDHSPLAMHQAVMAWCDSWVRKMGEELK